MRIDFGNHKQIMMNRKLFYLLLFLIPAKLFATDFSGVKGLIDRRVPWLKNNVEFVELKNNNKEAFTLQTKNNKLVIEATGPNAAATGLNWYLKYYCNRSMSHMGDNLAPVSPLPKVANKVSVDASAQYRHALNYCTFNYTMSFYNWNDWQRELDWMALNGVNLMLVANGEEAVWQNVLRKFGYTEQEIADFITGPAYNAWWLMGNIEGWGGPMPQSQIDSRKVMVQQMIERMRSLGIEPVMPAFFGMVPHNFDKKIKAHIVNQGTWGAFIRPSILDPTDPEFNRVAGVFYEETKKLYGANIKFFSGDPFHEGGTVEGVDLGKAGANIQRAMQQSFPGSTWVLQGWQDNPKKALLAETDKSSLLIQELFGENTNNWETRKAYEGTPFIWCTVTNFGERPGLNGKLQRFANEVHRASTGEFASYMKGVGIMPEGINNNPVAYEMLLELGWHNEQVNASEWLKSYVVSRYGKYNKDVADAWQLFLQTIYSDPGYQEGPPESVLCSRPNIEIKSTSSWGKLKKGYDIAKYEQAVKLFAAASGQFKNSETYKIDLINFGRQVLANRADTVFANMVQAYKAKDVSAFNTVAGKFLQLHDLTNDLLNADKYYRLTTYQQQSVRAGNTAEEKKNNLHNAMMLITYWGENNRNEDNLHEYAYKEWAGMMQTYYKKRWELYFDYLRNKMADKEATAPDYFGWERAWATQNEVIAKDQKVYPSADEVIKKIFK